MNKKTKRLILLAVLVVGLIFISLYFWPTLYRYDQINIAGEEYPVRIQRLTGQAEVLKEDGWSLLGSAGGNSGRLLSAAEVAQLSGHLFVAEYGDVRLQLYNGTDRIVATVTVEISFYKEDGTLLRRDLCGLSTATGGARAFQSADFSGYVEYPLAAKGKIEWRIVQASAR